AASDALVADAARETVGGEALEQELGRPSGGAEQVAKACQRDPPIRAELLREHGPRVVVRVTRDRITVAEAYESSSLLEELRERRVVDLRRLRPELRLERGGVGRAVRELGQRSRPVELRAAALELERRQHRVEPRLGGRRDAGIERVHMR